MDLQDAMAAPISVPRRGHVSGTDRPSALTAAVRLPSNARFEKLIAAIAERVLECSASHVVLVPHDELAYLPFWSLARPMPQVAISICQGANALLLFRRRKRDRNGTHIAVGDVTGTLEYTRPEIESLAGFIPEEPVKKAILGRLTFASMIQFAGHGIFNAEAVRIRPLRSRRRPAVRTTHLAGCHACLRAALLSGSALRMLQRPRACDRCEVVCRL
jgi:hypothetical protein